MNIKYVNICLDKEQFTEIVLDKVMPKVDYPKVKLYDSNALKTVKKFYTVMIIISIVGFIMANNIVSLIIQSVLGLYWINQLRETRRQIKQNEYNIIYTKNTECILRVLENEMNSVKETITFDDIVTSFETYMLGGHYRFLWIVYNAEILNIKVEDEKISVEFMFNGENKVEEFSDFFNKDIKDGNTLSISKDGLFLSDKGIISHAIKSITLSKLIHKNET